MRHVLKLATLAAGGVFSIGCGSADFQAELGEVEEGIINGRASWDANHERYIMQATVRLRNGQGGICSGTALRNDAIVTTRHCITVDGTREGTLALAGNLSVAASQNTPTAGCNSTTCRTVSAIKTFGLQDVALLFLSGNIQVNGSTTGFGMKTEPFRPAFHENQHVLVSGYGRNTENGAAGTLREGTVRVLNTDDIWYPGQLEASMILETVPATPPSAGGQIIAPGDSGGPTWNQGDADPANSSVTQIPMLLAVHWGISGSGDNTHAYAILANSFRWVDSEISSRTGTLSSSLTSPNFLSSLERREPATGTSGPTNWVINSSGLSEASNFNTPYPAAEGTMQIHRSKVYEDFDMRVDVKGTDDDSVGMIFWYVDDDNYLRFSVDEQRRFARIIRMHPRGAVILAENTDFDVDFNPGIQLRINTTAGSKIDAYVNGQEVLSVRDPHIMIGRVGLYENGMSNVAFTNWNVVSNGPTFDYVPYP